MSPMKLVSRSLLVVALLAILSCSGESTKGGKDGQHVDRKGLTGQKLIDSFDDRHKGEAERKGVAADIYLLGLAYTTHWEWQEKPPTQLQDIERYFSTTQPEQLRRNVRDNIDFVWNIKPPGKPLDRIILVYERNPDMDGNRLVFTGKGNLRLVDDGEFRTALKTAQE